LKINIEKYNKEWIVQFEQIKAELCSILIKLCPKIEHIGSTSVPNLAAKPIIDIQVGIENSYDLDKTIEPMINTHYIYYEIYNSVMPNRRLFVGLKDKKYIRNFQNIYSKGDLIPHEKINQLRLTHIHIWEHGTDDWNRHIAFRDYLREHPEIASQYESLKKQLSLKDWKDGNEYNDAKDSFIKTEEAKAILWYRKNNQALFS